MELLNDKELLQNILKKYSIMSYFHTKDIDFRLIHYKKGELICSPHKPLQDILFVVQGQLKIYGIWKDGSMFIVGSHTEGAILGDTEFVRNTTTPFYCEAMSDMLCVTLSISQNRKLLEQDTAFLKCMLSSLAEKLENSAEFDLSIQTLEERLLMFLHERQSDHMLHGMEESAVRLHCSRRQLQRVVQKLCKEDKLRKVGRGTYVLNT